MKNAHLWACGDGNGGYDIGQGDATIATVKALRDIPRAARPDEYDPRTYAIAFKAAPDLLRAAKAVLKMREAIEYQTYGVADAMTALAKAVERAEGLL